MRVRINSSYEYNYGELSDTPEALKSSAPLFLVTDPGKTNMACVIGTVSGQVLRIFEFSGTGQDTSDYCQEFKRYLKLVLKGCTMMEVAQEKAVGKKGNEYFMSQLTLNEIRAILIEISIELTHRKPREINNWTWKSCTLPDGYRSRTEKGSYRYLSSIDYRYSRMTNDVTDVMCMYAYMVTTWKEHNKVCCNQVETDDTIVPQVAIVDESFIPKESTEFIYNSTFGVYNNAVYFANRVAGFGHCRIEPKYLTCSDLFKYATDLTPNSRPCLLVYSKCANGLLPL